MTVTTYVFDDDVRSELAEAVLVGATSIKIKDATGARNNAPDPAGNVAYMAIVDALFDPTKRELITYTGVTDNGDGTHTLTGVTKGQDGTTDQAWSADDPCYQPLPASLANTLQDKTKLVSPDGAIDPLLETDNDGAVWIKGSDTPELSFYSSITPLTVPTLRGENGKLVIKNGATEIVKFDCDAPADTFFLSELGRIGINNILPLEALDVAGNTLIPNDNAYKSKLADATVVPMLQINSSDNLVAWVPKAGKDFRVLNAAGDTVLLKVPNTGVVELYADGKNGTGHHNVLIVDTDGVSAADGAFIDIRAGGVSRAQIGSHIVSGGDSHLIFKNKRGGTLSEAMRVDESGKVGINTDSPTENLEVHSTIKIAGADYPGIKFESTLTTPDELSVYANADSLYFKNLDTGVVVAKLNMAATSTVFYTDASGNLGLGTTTPTSKLDVIGSISTEGHIKHPNKASHWFIDCSSLGSSQTFSKVLSLPFIDDGSYRNFGCVLRLLGMGSNSPGSDKASGDLYITAKQAATDFKLMIEGTYNTNVYYTWNTTTKVYDIWLNHGGFHNALKVDASVFPTSLESTYSIGQLDSQSTTSGLTSVTLGTEITNT